MSTMLDQVSQDVRFALRSLRRSPAVTTTIVLTLSFSIAIVATFYSFVNTIVRPLPYKDADRTFYFFRSRKIPEPVIDELIAGKIFDRVARMVDNATLVSARGTVREIPVTAVDSGF